jgi:hypothetical protein
LPGPVVRRQIMKSLALCVVLASFFVLGLSAAQPKAKHKAEPKKQAEYSKVEVRGKIGQGFERDPSPLRSPFETRSFYTIEVAGGEWRLDLDKCGEEVLHKNIGKQVTITGSFRGGAIRVKTLNGLNME